MNAKAIDISTVSGTYVYADQSGYATCSSDSVRVHHSDGTYSIFAHVVPITCNKSVSINQHIANTNSSQGHVHWANCDSNCLSASASGGTYANDLRPIYGVPPNSTCSWPYASGGGLNPGSCYIWPVCTPAQNGYAAERKLVATSGCASGYAWYACLTNSSSYGSGWYWSSCSTLQ